MTEYFVVDTEALCYQNDTHKDYHQLRYNVLTHFRSKRTSIWFPTHVRLAKENDFKFFRTHLPMDYLTTDDGGIFCPDNLPLKMDKTTEEQTQG